MMDDVEYKELIIALRDDARIYTEEGVPVAAALLRASAAVVISLRDITIELRNIEMSLRPKF